MNFKKSLTAITLATLLSSSAYLPATYQIKTNYVSAASTDSLGSISNKYATFYYKTEDNLSIIYSVIPKGVKNSNGTILVTLPKVINNKQVGIADQAFNNISDALEIDCSGIVKIGSNSFLKCNNIKKIYIGKECEVIAKRAFYNCNIENILFNGCTDINEILKNKSIEIKTKAFSNCTIGTLKFQDRLSTIIREDGFYNCKISNLDVNDLNRLDRFHPNNSAFGTSYNYNALNLLNASNDFLSSGVYNKASAKMAKGDCLVIVCFMDVDGKYKLSENEKNKYISHYLSNNTKFIKSQANEYNVDIDFTIKQLNINVSSKDDIRSVNIKRSMLDHKVGNPEILKRFKDEYPQLNNCNSIQNVAIDLNFNYDNISLTFVYPIEYAKSLGISNPRAYAEPKKSLYAETEYLVDYANLSKIYSGSLTWAHEFMHLNGAIDLYDEGEYSKTKNPDYFSQKYYMDLMNHHTIKNETGIGWLTAASVGWTNTVLKSDKLAVR